MDTIIYFYRNRELKEALAEPVGLKSYMLIRVGLNVGEGEWFGINSDMPSGMAPSGTEEGGAGRKGPEKRKSRKPSRRERRKQERREAAERERLLAMRAENIRRTERDMRALAAEILELAGEESRCFAVYEDSVRKVLLQGEHVLPSLWRRYMDFEEFSGYTKSFWAELMMPHAVLHHFVILGTAPCIPGLLEKYASKMKSLKWILAEEACGPELMNFVEDFYTEYGLAISLKTLSGGAEWKRQGELCALPSNILDFTGDSFLNVPRIPEGSIWLDFMSVEEKKRRIEGRCPGAAYFSLKGKWRRAQRRCKEP